MAGCVYHCITAVPHDVSNSYKSTLSLLDSKCFVALLYFFPLYFKLLSCVTIIYWHPNSSTVRRSTVPGKGDQTAPHLGRTGPEGSGGAGRCSGDLGQSQLISHSAAEFNLDTLWEGGFQDQVKHSSSLSSIVNFQVGRTEWIALYPKM